MVVVAVVEVAVMTVVAVATLAIVVVVLVVEDMPVCRAGGICGGLVHASRCVSVCVCVCVCVVVLLVVEEVGRRYHSVKAASFAAQQPTKMSLHACTMVLGVRG